MTAMRLPVSTVSVLVAATVGLHTLIRANPANLTNPANPANLANPANPANSARHVVLITIDGLRGDYLSKADAYRLRIANLRRLAHEGLFSPRTLSVFPSLTLTAHTTLVTGAAPNRHGILGNNKFDMSRWVFRKNRDNYDDQPQYRRYANIKTATLWSAAREAGLRTAAINWPETEGGPIDYRLDAPRAIDDRVADRRDALAAAEILKQYKPAFTAIHFSDPDKVQHASGPATPETFAAIEDADANIGVVLAAINDSGLGPLTTLIVTGDHGFLPMHTALAINVPLIEAGFITKGAGGHPSWTAAIAPNRGLGSLYMKQGSPAELAKARRALGKYAALYPGRFRIVERDELDRFGADRNAVLGVEPLPGYVLDACLAPPFERRYHLLGGHGYRPDTPGMESALIAYGAGVPRGSILPETRLIDVAPTIAAWLDIELPGADGRVIWPAGESSPAPRQSSR